VSVCAASASRVAPIRAASWYAGTITHNAVTTSPRPRSAC
jgi:hypothetical protein